MNLPKGARLLKETEVPNVGDFCRWSQSKRDEWIQIPQRDTFRSGLPVATLRARCGQSEMQFCAVRAMTPTPNHWQTIGSRWQEKGQQPLPVAKSEPAATVGAIALCCVAMASLLLGLVMIMRP